MRGGRGIVDIRLLFACLTWSARFRCVGLTLLRRKIAYVGIVLRQFVADIGDRSGGVFMCLAGADNVVMVGLHQAISEDHRNRGDRGAKKCINQFSAKTCCLWDRLQEQIRFLVRILPCRAERWFVWSAHLFGSTLAAAAACTTECSAALRVITTIVCGSFPTRSSA